MTTEQKIIDAMRANPDRRWSIAGLAQATGVVAEGIKTTVQSMRWAGKMEFNRLELSASLRAAPIVFSRSYRERAKTNELCAEHSRTAATAPVDARQLASNEIEGGASPSFRFKIESAEPTTPAAEAVPLVKTVPSRVRDDNRALDVLLADYLRPASPSFTSCFLRLCDWAKAEGIDLPSGSTMRRRVDAAVAKLGRNNPRLPASRVEPAEAIIPPAPTPDQPAKVESATSSLPVPEKAPANIAEAVATAMVEDLEDALLAAKRAWPDQWWRIIARARSRGVRVGVVFGEIVEAGLNVAGGR